MTAATFDALSDRLSPIVVKEVRQGLRARVFTGAFALALAASVLISLYAWWAERGGSRAFVAYFAVLAVVLFFVLPFNAYRSLSREREDETWSTVALTRLRARAIVRGRIASTLVQSALYASAVAPFLLFSYMLEGVSLAAILLVLALTAVMQPAVTIAAVFLAAIASRTVARGLALVAAQAGLGAFTWAAIALVEEFVWNSVDLLTADGLKALAILVVFVATLAVLLLELAASSLATEADNRAIGPRLALLTHLGIPAALLVVPATGERDLPLVFAHYASALLFLVGLYGLGDSDAPPRLVRQGATPKLLQPGALRWHRFVLVTSFVVSAAAFVGAVQRDGSDTWPIFAAQPAFVALYLSLPVVVARLAIPAHVAIAPARRALALGVVGFVLPASPIAALAMGEQPLETTLNLFNPLILPIALDEDALTWSDAGAGVAFVLVPVAAAVVVIADRLLAARERFAITRPEPR